MPTISTPPYLDQTTSFRMIDVEAAMCLWEAFIELRETDEAVKAALETHGTVAMRHAVMTLVSDCHTEWLALGDEETVNNLPYDWEWCPKFLKANMWRIGVGDKPITPIEDITIKLKWVWFKSHQMGRGWVAFVQSEEQKAEGVYDPHVMFAHFDADNEDPEAILRVERDCQALANLLDRFRIDNDCITDIVKVCARVPKMYDISVTKGERDMCSMVVEAETESAARAVALRRAMVDRDLVWEDHGGGINPVTEITVYSCELVNKKE